GTAKGAGFSRALRRASGRARPRVAGSRRPICGRPRTRDGASSDGSPPEPVGAGSAGSVDPTACTAQLPPRGRPSARGGGLPRAAAASGPLRGTRGALLGEELVGTLLGERLQRVRLAQGRVGLAVGHVRAEPAVLDDDGPARD